ncbi:MAG: 3-isopropylmalate dehydratase small subunit [Steroidobacteraceae bacterium]|jgi:3-isopropylmalate/(R)-2-methylmalate dehydratase small subunit|nr:3-isopropylmalate dehydratase small subunit [Gammaproteobacteria bacterium]
MQAIKTIHSRTVVMPSTNIDTDQIIPGRFLTTTTKEGLGQQLFADWRYAADGTPIADFILNRPEAEGCRILVAGRNLGCGSSREHAPWALLDYGFQAVVSTEIADIFRNNSLKNGLLPIVVDDATHQWLLANPGVTVTIDLQSATLQAASREPVSFPIDAFARYCLLNGVDELGFLLSKDAEIQRYESQHAG